MFFNSIVEKASEIIICFGPSSTKAVSTGREMLKSSYPFDNVTFLDIPESNVYDGATWLQPHMVPKRIRIEDISVGHRFKKT